MSGSRNPFFPLQYSLPITPHQNNMGYPSLNYFPQATISTDCVYGQESISPDSSELKTPYPQPPWQWQIPSAPHQMPDPNALFSDQCEQINSISRSLAAVSYVTARNSADAWVKKFRTVLNNRDNDAIDKMSVEHRASFHYFLGEHISFSAGTFVITIDDCHINFESALRSGNINIIRKMLVRNWDVLINYIKSSSFIKQAAVLKIVLLTGEDNEAQLTDEDNEAQFIRPYIKTVEHILVLYRVSSSASQKYKVVLKERIDAIFQNQRILISPTPPLLPTIIENPKIDISEFVDSMNISLEMFAPDAEETDNKWEVCPFEESFSENIVENPNIKSRVKPVSIENVTRKRRQSDEECSTIKKTQSETVKNINPALRNLYLEPVISETKSNNHSLSISSINSSNTYPAGRMEECLLDFRNALRDCDQFTFRPIWRDNYPTLCNYILSLVPGRQLEILKDVALGDKPGSLTLFILVYIRTVRDINVLKSYLLHEARDIVDEEVNKRIAVLESQNRTFTSRSSEIASGSVTTAMSLYGIHAPRSIPAASAVQYKPTDPDKINKPS